MSSSYSSFIRNPSFEFITEFRLVDFNDQTSTIFNEQHLGLNHYSMPLIIDLDGDNQLDIIYAINTIGSHWYEPDGFQLFRGTLNIDSSTVAWGGYMGMAGDGVYPNVILPKIPLTNTSIQVFPNPAKDYVQFNVPFDKTINRIHIYTTLGQLVLTQIGNRRVMDIKLLRKGTYFYQIEVDGVWLSGKILKI